MFLEVKSTSWSVIFTPRNGNKSKARRIKAYIIQLCTHNYKLRIQTKINKSKVLAKVYNFISQGVQFIKIESGNNKRVTERRFNMKYLRYTAYALVLIGALNWGLVGLFGFDLVAAIFGDMTLISRIIYSLVGISAVVTALMVHHCEPVRQTDSCEYGNCKF